MIKIVVMCIALFTQCVSGAGTDSVLVHPTCGQIFLDDTRMLTHHTISYFNNAVEITNSKLITTGTLIGVTASLFLVDKNAQSLANRNHSSFNNALFRYTEFYGTTGTAIALTGSVYGAGLLFGNTEVRTTGVLMFESLAFSAVITSILKSALGRSRPYMNEGNLKFRGMQFKTGTTALPSGHTTAAFALSSVLSERCNNTFASIGLYTLASLTAAARVYHNDHWISDTFLGAAIGTAVGITVANYSKDKKSSPIEVSIVPNAIQIQFTL